jgi:murein DD-endopeptidase MepM/ murein hydrolase activator NlpD
MARFPLSLFPLCGFHKGSGKRWFGAPRDGGERQHAGCDLIAKAGTPIYAVAGGTVLRKVYFYSGTYELQVDHTFFIARYGEIAKELADGVEEGKPVSEGQHIANVGQLNSGSAMLHFEMYKGTSSGYLTQTWNKKYDYVDGSKFKRRPDLLDPTPYLEEWAMTTGVF